MFSLQNQNQVLFHLSQITSNLSPRTSGQNRRNSAPRKIINQNNGLICSPESFHEVLKNCTEFPLKQLATIFKCSSTEDITNTANQLWMLYHSPKPPRIKLKKSPWSISYKSADTFFENKHGFPMNVLDRPFPTLLSPQSQFINLTSTQIRHFKTDRNVNAEKSRNPSIFQRIKQFFLPAFPSQTSTPVADSQFHSPLSDSPTSAIAGEVAGEKSNEKFTALLNDKLVKPEEQHRMKLAFAEGYVAGTTNRPTSRTMRWFKVFQQFLTVVLFVAICASLLASASGSIRIQLGNQVEVDPEEIHVTFDDVKGADEAKQELRDVVEFLKNPEKFSHLGGKLPKGVLLVGPPGTGKTLLARAVAGEAGVPFFHAAGPEFDEILVGQGARRVRDLFKAAKDRSPCVIFIDEIDSVGAKRTNSVLHPYANQTINQLLTEMDGFHQNEGVIVLGATNRREDLDKALLRPGRFDVEVTVPTPDYTGRKQILDLYLGKVLSKDVDVDMLARGTTGFTGADLESMVNQAALRAAIDGADSVTMKYLENARDKVLMGPERKSRLPDEEANRITAYHEGGHAIVSYFTKYSHPLHKVTIIPRGPSLGHTAYIPEKERYHVTKAQLLAMMDTMMGGRAAEELIFGPDKITSGASSDLQQATAIATHMVKEWGMSEKLGLRTLETSKQTIVINELSPSVNEVVDLEIKRIMMESYERAKAILKAHQKEHKMLAEALIKYETLDADDIKAIMMGSETIPGHKDKTAPA